MVKTRGRPIGGEWEALLYLVENHRKTIGKMVVFNGILNGIYPLVMTDSLLLNMAIELVSFPIEQGDFPW